VRQGIVDAEILAEAAEQGAGLVVMTNRPSRGPVWLGGSDETRELVRNGSLPVVLVNQDRPTITRLRTILAPVERVHAPGLVYALALAQAAHARLVLLRVVGRVGANASAAELESKMKSLVDQADAIVCDVRVAGAPVAESIITTAGQVGADLIAMTTSPTDRLGGTWLGKIVEAVLASAPQPVLLVNQQRVASLAWSASGE
jgi:nucleotide-binding universal stress UspA family protein